MPGIWKWMKSQFVVPATVQREPYIPTSTASLQDVFDSADSVVYYFYKDNCPYCEEIDAFFEGIPEQVLLQDGSISSVKLVCVNKNVDADVCNEYYEQVGISKEERFVPAVVIGSEYLFAPSEIMEGTYRILLSGEARNTPMIGENIREQ